MMNRISLTQVFSRGLNGILNVQSQLAKTQEQISSGKRVVTPSDDPVAAARILQLESEQARVKQYQKNIDGAVSSLDLEESQLESVENILVRVRERAIQAGSGALSFSERQAIAEELETRLAELGGLANTRSASGEYIFGGYKGEQEPFVRVGNDFTYRGDDGQRLVQVASSTQVAINDSGNAIFIAVASPRLAGTAAVGNAGSATISSGHVVDQAAFDANFSGSYTITFTSPTTYDIVPVGGGPAVVSGAAYTSGEDIVFNGVSMKIVGTPATGDDFQVDPPATQSIFSTVGKLIDGLRTYSDGADDKIRMQELIAETLDNNYSAEENVSVVRSRIGARLNTLESTEALHAGTDLVNKKVLADVRDLDHVEAITRLTQENFVLQAAQQSFAKIAGLSLFDFLR